MFAHQRAIVAMLGSLAIAAAAARPPHHDRLFVIARSVNANVVVYDALRRPDGRLDLEDPVSVYWLMNAEHGQREKLNLLEKTKAYGFDVVKKAPGRVRITVKALDRRPIEVRVVGRRTLALTRIAGHEAILRRVFVKTRPDDPLDVEYIELYGENLRTRRGVRERVRQKG
jgi:Domain of unknown function (DUF4833)